MTKEQVQETIRSYVIENFVLDEEVTVDDDDSLQDSEIIDSAGVLNLIVFVEEEFNVVVGEDEVTPENMDSISGLARFVASKLASD